MQHIDVIKSLSTFIFTSKAIMTVTLTNQVDFQKESFHQIQKCFWFSRRGTHYSFMRFCHIASVEWCLQWQGTFSKPCCSLINPLSAGEKGWGRAGRDRKTTRSPDEQKCGTKWPFMSQQWTSYRGPLFLLIVCELGQLWRACFQHSCLILPPGSMRGKKKRERQREAGWREDVITELRENPDKLSALEKALSNKRKRPCFFGRRGFPWNVRRPKYKHVFVSACCLPPLLGPIPTWCSHVGAKSAPSCHACKTFAAELWVIANKLLWRKFLSINQQHIVEIWAATQLIVNFRSAVLLFFFLWLRFSLCLNYHSCLYIMFKRMNLQMMWDTLLACLNRAVIKMSSRKEIFNTAPFTGSTKAESPTSLEICFVSKFGTQLALWLLWKFLKQNWLASLCAASEFKLFNPRRSWRLCCL